MYSIRATLRFNVKRPDGHVRFSKLPLGDFEEQTTYSPDTLMHVLLYTLE